MNPASASAHELIGNIHLHRNVPSEAIAEFTRSLHLSPDNPVVTANLGYAHMLLHNWTQAKALFEKALTLDSTLAETRNNLGIVLAKMGDYDGALAQMERVSGRGVAFNNLGVVLLVLRKDPAAAIQAFEQALRYIPDYEKAQANLAAARLLLPIPAVIDLPPARRGQPPVEPPSIAVAHMADTVGAQKDAVLPVRKLRRSDSGSRVTSSMMQSEQQAFMLRSAEDLILARPRSDSEPAPLSSGAPALGYGNLLIYAMVLLLAMIVVVPVAFRWSRDTVPRP
jgi:Flp pilus assembly protein TadD